jgi:tartrate dehydratase beta subunit/fumarate hydratase class I family protein
MTNKITVVVDLDDDLELTEHGSLERGVYGIDRDGVFHMYYSVKTYLVSFSPHTCERVDEYEKERIENEQFELRIKNDYNTSYDNAMQMKKCEYCGKYECNCEQIIDKNIQAQERTEP